MTEPIAATALDRRRVCALQAQMRRGSIARWDNTNWNGTDWVGKPRAVRIRWNFAPGVPDIFAPAINWAWERWAEVCAIAPEYTPGADQVEVVYHLGDIDGPHGTLAWAELPDGPDRTLKSRMDGEERWHFDPHTKPPAGKLHLGGVMCHENGHLLGIEHDEDTGRALMDPTYGPDVLTPQPLDIKQAVLRYGPAADVGRDAPLNPATKKPVSIYLDGVVYHGEVTSAARGT